MKRLHIIGRKNHGKTTLVLELLAEFQRRGLRVGSIKHSAHVHEIDREGTDSLRHRQAGASPVAVVTAELIGVLRPRVAGENYYAALAPQFAGCDLVVVEGDQDTPPRPGMAKLEVWRAERGTTPIAFEREDVFGVITDDKLPQGPRFVPTLRRSDVAKIADAALLFVGENPAPPPTKVHVYILAGGKSSRFGSDKAIAELGGETLIKRVAAEVAPVAASVTVVADVANKYSALGLRTIADEEPHLGPVGGLATALIDAGDRVRAACLAAERKMPPGFDPAYETWPVFALDGWSLVIACDTLGFRPEWFETLRRAADYGAAAIAFRGDPGGKAGGWEPLPALYHLRCVRALDELLRAEGGPLWKVLDGAKTTALALPAGWSERQRIDTREALERYGSSPIRSR